MSDDCNFCAPTHKRLTRAKPPGIRRLGGICGRRDSGVYAPTEELSLKPAVLKRMTSMAQGRSKRVPSQVGSFPVSKGAASCGEGRSNGAAGAAGAA